MNHDDKDSPENAGPRPFIEPELEARVVASVLGEASPFEDAEIERLCHDNPELAIFKRRIEAVHGLLGAASRRERDPLRLTPERRAKVLEKIRGTDEGKSEAAKAGVLATPQAASKRRPPKIPNWAYALAASLVLCALIGGVSISRYGETFSVSVDKVREMAEREKLIAARRTDRMSETREDAESGQPEFASENSLRAPETRRGALENAKVVAEVGDRKQKSAAGPPPVPVDRASAPTNVMFGMPPVAARTAPPPSADPEGDDWFGEQVELSPFEVTAKQDTGYAASHTLAGTRVQIPFADVGSAISVPTRQFLSDVGGKADARFNVASGGSAAHAPGATDEPTLDLSKEFGDADKSPRQEFLKDVGATDSRTLLQYTANTEVGGVMGNFAGHADGDPRIAASEARKNAVSESKIQSRDPAGVVDQIPARKNVEKGKGRDEPSAPARPAVAPDTSLVTEISSRVQPVSTFSLHVSDVSFRLAQAALARGEKPDPSRIRPEEFYNAFDYGDPVPTTAEKIGCRIEQSAHPFMQQRNLVRIAMRVPSTGRGAGQPMRLTVLLDTSGSMERDDRTATVQRALQVLASLLGANDRVTLIGFARRPRLLADDVPGNEAAKLADIAARTPADGGTNMEEALKLAAELARRHQDASAQNRIVLMTDGAANLGNADPAQLASAIETLRQQGIAFDACGVGTDGLDDEILEALTRKGDGRYYVLDTPADADAGFARQLAGAFHPAAQNVKVQVRFNPARVGRYRLIGFEQHRLRAEDFRNDTVDAAELAAGEAAVALYQVEVLPEGEGELGDVFVRFRDTSSGQMVERSWTMMNEPHARAFDKATPGMQLAGTAAMLAEALRGGEAGEAVQLDELAPVVTALRSHFANNARVLDLVTMFEQTRRLERK